MQATSWAQKKKCSIQGKERRYAKANHFSVDLLIDWDKPVVGCCLGRNIDRPDSLQEKRKKIALNEKVGPP